MAWHRGWPGIDPGTSAVEVALVDASRIDVQIGASSADIRLHASCVVAGPTRRVGEDRSFLAGVTVEPT